MPRESGLRSNRFPIAFGLDEQRRAIELRLAELVPRPLSGDRLAAAMRYGLLAPGKRLRPLLVIAAAAQCDGPGRGVLDLACAVEMIHAASLIMDDLPAMDDADVRRGQPSTHKAYGEDVALLSSVALISQAQKTVASMTEVDPEIRCRLLALLAEASGCDGLSKGQMFDLAANPRSGASEIERVNHFKTGVLFAAAVEAATILCEAPAPVRERLRRFAIHFGHAFQLADDLEDGRAGNGEDRSRRTSVEVLGLQGVRLELERHVSLARGCVGSDTPLAGFVSALGHHAIPGRRAGGLRAAV